MPATRPGRSSVPGRTAWWCEWRTARTRRSQVFAALVDSEEEGPFRPGKPGVVVTLRVIGDDMADYLDIGSHFILWSGSDVGRGVVTRRLFH
jgi:hypothetical protein